VIESRKEVEKGIIVKKVKSNLNVKGRSVGLIKNV
jgi:hypothetical protein